MKYSINLSEEYRILKKINDTRNYFQHRNYNNIYEQEIKKLNELEKTIVDKLLKTIRQYGAAMLEHPDTEFGL
jgi:hypothetical protein